MHLSFNMLTAGGGKSGVYNYLVRMAIDFPKAFPDDKFTIIITPDLQEICDLSIKNVEVVVSSFASKSSLKRMLWEQFYLPYILKIKKIDLVYTFSVTDIIFSPCPTVIRVGNMLPYSDEAMQFQTGLKAKLRLYYLRIMLRISLHTANAALVMSEPAANILIKQNKYPNNKIIGINRGVTLKGIKKNNKEITNLPDEYILTVSHIQVHKRLEEIIKGYALTKSDIPLLIVGCFSDKKFHLRLITLVKKLNLNNKVVFFGRIERSKLYKVIKPAKIVIFPSMVETYPSSLLEPMLAGSAMVVSDRGVMPAFCGDAVLYYDPTSPEELAMQLHKYLDSDELIETMKSKLNKHMVQLDTSWETAINKRYELFNKIVMDR